MVWKLAASFAAVLLLFAAVLGAVFVTMFRQHTIAINRAAMEERALSIAETLGSFETGGGGRGMGHGGGGGSTGGHGAYMRFLDELSLAEVWIVDEGLNLLTPTHGHTTTYAELPDNAEQIVSRVFTGELTYGEEFSGLLDAPTLTVGAPIRTGSGITGAVLLHSPVSGVEEAVRQGLSALIWGVLIALVLSSGAAVWLSYRFTRPLGRMKNTALCLAQGDYAASTGVAQRDEIGQLAETIDLLAGRLALAEQERAALDQLREDFVANVSHELRTPVAVLRGSVEVLRDGTVSSAQEVSDYYEQMLAESRHLERLVNDLLDLSRLQDAQFHLDFAHINLCDVVRDGARSIRRLAAEKELELSVDCPEEECLVRADYGRIRQVLLILLDNGVKFSPPGERVAVSLQKEGDGYLLTVCNRGENIPQEELPHLFDRFYKTSNRQNRTGTGLGLSIAKEIADRHGATIWAQSGGGETRFMVRLKGL